MENVVNREGYLRLRLMDIANELLALCNEMDVKDVKLMTSGYKDESGISLLAEIDNKPILSVKMDMTYENE